MTRTSTGAFADFNLKQSCCLSELKIESPEESGGVALAFGELRPVAHRGRDAQRSLQERLTEFVSQVNPVGF
jgi:hypothetical protein